MIVTCTEPLPPTELNAAIESRRFGTIVKSPGVSRYRPIFLVAREAGIAVTSNLNLWGEEGAFLAARPARPPAQDGDVVREGDSARPPLNLFAAPAGVETRLPDEQDVPPPPYPPALRGSGIEGTVMLQVRIDRRGGTNDPVILESPHPILALAAADRVSEWRYRPAEVDGQKVDVYYSLRLDFRAE